jgi:hypothetical protein
VTPEDRIAQIEQLLAAIRPGWSALLAVMAERVDYLTVSLIGENNEQTRGRIKALRELMELPERLTQERDGLSAALAE